MSGMFSINYASIGTVSIAAFLILLLFSMLWALVRGVTKARIRFALILLCAVAAFVVTMGVKKNLANAYIQYEPEIQAFFAENNMGDAGDFIGNSEALRDTILSSSGAILAPILFVVLFTVFRIVTWILYFLITLILRKPIKRREERRHLRPLRSMVYGIVQHAVILFVLLTPVYCYLQFAPALVRVADEANAIPEEAREVVNEENIEKLNQSQVFAVYVKLGGSRVDKELTKIEIRGETTYLADEIGAILSMVDEATALKNAGSFENWGSEQAEAIQSIAGSLGDSKIISSLIGEVIGGATDKWLAGEAFMGTAKPSIGESFDPVFDILLQNLNRDAKSQTAISNDLKTIGDLISILVRDGVISKMKDSDGISALLANGNTIKDMISVLNANESMRNLISELSKFGMKAVGNMLKLPEVDLSDYEQFFDEVTDKLNEVLEGIDFEDETSVKEAVSELTDKLQVELEQANVNVTLSDEIIDIYSDIIIQELKDKEGPVTIDDLKELFGITTLDQLTEAELGGEAEPGGEAESGEETEPGGEVEPGGEAEEAE